MTARRSAGTPATAVLDRDGVAYEVHAYEHHDGEQHYGAEAVAELGLDARRTFKTLLVELSNGELVTAVLPVATMLDLKALAAATGVKRASLADPATAERVTGMVVGGISPLGQRQRRRCVVDASALEHDTIWCSAGRRGLQMQLSPTDLVRLAEAVTATIGR